VRKIKRRIEVGGREYKIKIYKRIPKDVFKELGDISGWCDHNRGVIGLIKPYDKSDVLFHEIGHAAADTVRSTNPLANESFARPFFSIFFAALKSAGLIREYN
jgi:hypothetical protein